MLQQSLEMGGAERQGLHLARWLKEEHEVTIEVWGLNHPGSVSTWCDAHQIPWRLINWQWNGSRQAMLSGMFRLFLELRKAKPDVLLPYTMPPNIACGFFWRMAGARTCIWNQRDEGRQRFAPWLERRAVHNTPCFISNSCHAAEFLTTELGVPQGRVEVIHNGIELAEPKCDRVGWRLCLGIPPDTPIVCMVANLHAFKDHPTLLRAWQLVVGACGQPAPILLLAGHDYGIGAKLKALAKQLQISGQVRFLGHVDDIPGLLAASDLGVFSSLKEGVPNGVLECMATGLPVVATDIPGTREAFGDANLQFLAAPENPAAMAEILLLLLKDQTRRQQVGQSNLERVRSEFSKEQMNERYCKVIAKVLNA